MNTKPAILGLAPADVSAPADWRLAAVDYSPVGMAVLSLDQTVMHANPAMSALLEGFAGRLLDPDDAAGLTSRAEQNADLRQLMAGHRQTCSLYKRVERPDGAAPWLKLQVAAMPGPGPAPSAFIVHAYDVSDELRAAQRSRWLALHDPLTGLGNRAQLEERLLRAQDRDYRTDTGPAVLYIDLDGFKKVNDTHGHRAGDEVLIDVAHRIMRAVRASDTVARIGGDEFVVVLDCVGNLGHAHLVSDKIHAALAERQAYAADGITASIGVALGGHQETADRLLQRADEALYEAKRDGKNQTATAAPTLSLLRPPRDLVRATAAG